MRGKWSTIVAWIMAGALMALIAWGEFSAWNSERERVKREVANLAVSYVQHVEDTFEKISVQTGMLVDGIQSGDASSAESLREGLIRIRSQSPEVMDLAVYDEVGKLVVSSRAGIGGTDNASGRPFFDPHARTTVLAPLIGEPYISTLSRAWVIPLSRRVERADHSFAGVVVANIRCRYFSDHFSTFSTGKEGFALMVTSDGVIMAQSPSNETVLGTSISGQPLFRQHLSRTIAGVVEYQLPDDLPRIGGFYRAQATGLIVLAAVGSWETFGEWAAGATFRWLTTAVFLLLSGTLAISFARGAERRRLLDRQLSASQAEFRMLAENSQDLVERLDPKGTRQYVSPSALSVVGRSAKNLIGTNLLDSVHPDDRGKVEEALVRLGRATQSETIEFRNLLEGGGVNWLETRVGILPHRHGGGAGLVAVTRDITVRKTAELRLSELASLDGLTGLVNRRTFDERLALEIDLCHTSGADLAVILLDVDRFKAFNDRYGHVEGDNCLREIARAVSGCVTKPTDMVARYGGEEIVVLLPDSGLAGAMEVAERMRAAVEELGLLHEGNVGFRKATLSAGVSALTWQGAVGRTPTGLLASADEALYAAKANGRNQVRHKQHKLKSAV